jgi:Rrf2 family cysteine metabolism transcriptional repressor
MFKVSTKGRYGLRAMIELAASPENEPMLMGKIAQRQGFSRKYLHALLTSLKEAGLVQSVRGSRGGYMLAKSADDIRISDVVEALEGPLAIVDCLNHEDTCSRTDECLARGIWKELNTAMAGVLTNMTLADLTNNNKEKK